MSQRLSLAKLISYVQTIRKNDENPNDLEIKNDDKIDEFKFEILEPKEKKVILDFPDKIKQLFDPFLKNIHRCGSIDKFKGQEQNVSLFYSILFCLINDFTNLSLEQQEKQILLLRKKLHNKDFFLDNNYESLGWKKKDLFESLNEFKNNKMILRSLADYFNINIFLLNIGDERIYAIYPEDLFNMFKMNIFLCVHDDHFESLIYENNKQWKYNFDVFKKLITIDKEKINVLDVNLSNPQEKIFKIGMENLDKYIILEENKENEYNENDQEEDLFIKEIEDSEMENINIENVNSIFLIKINDKKDLENISPNTPYTELQQLARKYYISLEYPDAKLGKVITRNKNDLIKELKKIK